MKQRFELLAKHFTDRYEHTRAFEIIVVEEKGIFGIMAWFFTTTGEPIQLDIHVEGTGFTMRTEGRDAEEIKAEWSEDLEYVIAWADAEMATFSRVAELSDMWSDLEQDE